MKGDFTGVVGFFLMLTLLLKRDLGHRAAEAFRSMLAAQLPSSL